MEMYATSSDESSQQKKHSSPQPTVYRAEIENFSKHIKPRYYSPPHTLTSEKVSSTNLANNLPKGLKYTMFEYVISDEES